MKNKYNPTAVIIGEPEIGDGTWIGYYCLIDGSGGLKIGKLCDISSGVHIYTHDTVRRCIMGRKYDEDGKVRRDLISKEPVRIGDYTFVGAGSVILKGSDIGSKCIIPANSVVRGKLEDGMVWRE